MSTEIGSTEPGSEKGQPIRFHDFVAGCFRFRYMIFGVILTCGFGATAFAFLSTPTYKASVLMAPVQEDAQQSRLLDIAGQFGGLAAQLGLGSTSSNMTQEAIATLKSRAFLESFIQTHDLIPILFDDRWDSESMEWRVDDASDIPTLEDAYIRFDRMVNVSQDLQTGLVRLTIDWKARELIPEWANQLVKQVNARLRDKALSESQRGLAYLNDQLAKTSVVELRAVIYRLIEGNIQNIMLANAREEYAFRVIDPAVISDPGNFVRPKRLLIIAVGIIFGSMIAIALVMLRLSLGNMSRLS